MNLTFSTVIDISHRVLNLLQPLHFNQLKSAKVIEKSNDELPIKEDESSSAERSAKKQKINEDEGISSTDIAGPPRTSQVEDVFVTQPLVNLGKTCFLNVILQALAHTKEVRDFLLSETFEDYSKTHICAVTTELAKIIKDMLKESTSAVCPADLKGVLSNVIPICKGNKHQDPQELLAQLLSVINDELNQDINILEVGSSMNRIFTMSLASQIKCMLCGGTNYHAENLTIMSVAITEETSSIIDCLYAFLGTELVDNRMCQECGNCSTAEKWYSFRESPQILIIHLKRYSRVSTGRRKIVKIDKELDVPHHIDISEECYDGTILMKNYELYACVVHCGSMPTSGHYTAYCKASETQFGYYDDAHSFLLPAEEVDIKNSYLMFY